MSRRVRYQQKNDGSGLYNCEGYWDETAYPAILHVEAEERKKRRAESDTGIRADLTVDQNANEALHEDEQFRWEELANAIIIQAAQDWRMARSVLQDEPRDIFAQYVVEETEQFFLSDFYTKLTKHSGRKLLERLRKEFY